MQSDVRSRLQDALREHPDGHYCYYEDHSGDGESGDVIYCCDGDLMSCPYEVGTQGGKAVVYLDIDNAKDVVRTTTYQEEADDDDHYASMEESFKTSKLYTELPLYERFISKGERDKADEGSFAGKGKSFPILKPGDVTAAVHAMGRAGSSNYGMAQLKANIIRIAKKKGWTSSLPKSWQESASTTPQTISGSAHSSLPGGVSGSGIRVTGPGQRVVFSAARGASVNRGTDSDSIRLVESAATVENIVLREAKADYEIKLIAPGKGSSAFYPAEVLKRDGPKVFGPGTHVYLNHATAAEEAARPEGDVKNLAGVLTTAAAYNESHAKGPGLYARMKVFADHSQTVEEKAAHVGMSIRASGVAESGKSKDGLPILKELTSAESVDVVTRAGAGGMILTESARGAGEGDCMTLEEAKKLIEAEVAPFRQRALRGDAREEAERLLESASLPKETKARIIEAVLKDVPVKDGTVDLEAFRPMVVAEAKREGEYLARVTGSGQVRGLGISLAPALDPEKLKEARKEAKRARKDLYVEEREVFGRLTGSEEAGKRAARHFEEEVA